MGAKDSIGSPGYLRTAVPPAYGTADSNGYIGVSQDYNKHANATDRPKSTSVAVADDELEQPDMAHQAGEHDGPKAVHEDDFQAEQPDAAHNRKLADGDDDDDEDDDDKRASSRRHAPAKKVGGTKLADQAKAGDKSGD
jgi:hypothetical protein